MCYFQRKSIFSGDILYLRGTPICCISDLGCFDRFDDGKLNNSTLLNSLSNDIENCLDYNGVVSKIRWVPPPKSGLFVEIVPEKRFFF